jgi:hypothetical protein
MRAEESFLTQEVVMRSSLVVFGLAVVLAGSALALEPFHDAVGRTCRMEQFEWQPYCLGKELAQRIADPRDVIPEPVHYTWGSGVPSRDWSPVDTLAAHLKVHAGSRYVVCFDYNQQELFDLQVSDSLTDLAWEAVERAPTWLAEELTDNLRRLEPASQNTFSQLILNGEHPVVDEIAYQVARMAPRSLTHELFDAELIVLNAELLYEHDEVLQYVEIVDYGSAGSGGDYYSTTRYRYIDAGDTVWVEIPKEMYYWYVVHPKLSDETAKMSSEPSNVQSTYGYFWREYLFSNPDSVYDYSESGGVPGVYPILGDVLANPTVLWDGEQYDLPGGRPFEEDDMALDVIGNWVSTVVPNAASGNRPVQPNQIVYEHNGNCGELQDVLAAAGRVGLIPTICISDHCEDHVWNEFFWETFDDEWHPYQVDLGGGGTHIDNPGIAYDADYGGGKDVSGVWAWRGDGYTWATVDRYSNYCTLIVYVEDSNAKPVDGALVLLWSDAWGGGGLTACIWAYTDSRGFCTFMLGDLQDYYLHVNSIIGDYPAGGLDAVVQIIDDSEEGQPYFKSVTLPGAVTRVDYAVDSEEGNDYQLLVRFETPHEIIYGENLYGEDPDFAKREGPGSVDVFVTDAANYDLFDFGDEFTAAWAADNASSGEALFMFADNATDWYVSFTSEDHVVNTQGLDVEVILYQQSQGISDVPLVVTHPVLLQNQPNPFVQSTAISYAIPDLMDGRNTPRIALEIFNTAGRRVKTLFRGEQQPGWHQILWDGSDDGGLTVASGVYVYRLAVWPTGEDAPLVRLKPIVRSY